MLRFLLRTAIGTEQIYGGTYEYLAPEAMAGATRANQDAIVARETQDAYSVGVTAYQVVTRNHLPPFAMEVCRHPVLLCMRFFSLAVPRGSRFARLARTLPNDALPISFFAHRRQTADTLTEEAHR